MNVGAARLGGLVVWCTNGSKQASDFFICYYVRLPSSLHMIINMTSAQLSFV